MVRHEQGSRPELQAAARLSPTLGPRDPTSSESIMPAREPQYTSHFRKGQAIPMPIDSSKAFLARFTHDATSRVHGSATSQRAWVFLVLGLSA